MAVVTATEIAYQSYVQGVAYRTQSSEDEVREEISVGDFLIKIHDLHDRYLKGEFSIGRLAELLGVDPFRLDFLLTTLGLSVHN